MSLCAQRSFATNPPRGRRHTRRPCATGGVVAATLLVLFASAAASAQVPAPEAFFGFRMGADGQLASWTQIQRYFEAVAAASDRVELVEVGPTTDGNTMIAAIVSAPENIGRLDAIKAANRRLADPRGLSDEDARRLAADHRAVLAIGCSIHASEIGATQAANELLYTMATTTDPRLVAALRDVVLLLIPSLNPDGHTLVVDWYQKHKGTPFEGSPMPWLYHKYVGHDLNRDAFMLNMSETHQLARFFYREWHPQVFLTMHQMGPRGPRFFVPPNYDPIDPNYDPLIWREAALLGHAMALELERDGRAGVVSNAMYDYFWPGYEDSAPLGHNTVCLLTEVASVRIASPTFVAPGELTGTPRGLPDYRPQVNFPNPWPGGAWRLRDIVEYELSAACGLLGAVARYRGEIVENFYRMGRRAVEQGRTGNPFAFIIPPEQHDPLAAAKLTNLLIDAGVEVHRAIETFRAGPSVYPAGTDIILLTQPFRAYAKTLLERQVYPVRRLVPGAAPERPYDVTGWTLPYQMGVQVDRIENPFEPPAMSRLDRAIVAAGRLWSDRRPSYYLVDGRGNGGAMAVNRLLAAGLAPSWTATPAEAQGFTYPAGSIVLRYSPRAQAAIEKLVASLGVRATGVKGRMPAGTIALKRARVALYKPWVENIDEGWTRWLLEQYEFPFRNVADADIRRGNLRAQFDVIILPDAPADRLIAGHAPGVVPPAYAGGLGEEGVAALRAFVEAGGTLVCLDSSSGLAISALNLPVKDVLNDVPADRFFCPGSILRIETEPSQPLAFGMETKTAAFFAYGSAYDTSAPQTTEGHGGAGAPSAVRVIARYAPGDLLMSGWLEGEPMIAGRAAALEARAGLGRAILIGFRTQHRGQTHATFRLLFNAILTSAR